MDIIPTNDQILRRKDEYNFKIDDVDVKHSQVKHVSYGENIVFIELESDTWFENSELTVSRTDDQTIDIQRVGKQHEKNSGCFFIRLFVSPNKSLIAEFIQISLQKANDGHLIRLQIKRQLGIEDLRKKTIVAKRLMILIDHWSDVNKWRRKHRSRVPGPIIRSFRKSLIFDKNVLDVIAAMLCD